jgi:hypothetical protein
MTETGASLKRCHGKTMPRRGYLFDALVSFPAPLSAVGQRSSLSDEHDHQHSSERPNAPALVLPSQWGHGTETRRLAAIVAADVVGYSRLIGKMKVALSETSRRSAPICSSRE